MFENWDLAQVMLYLFWIFFAGILLYLRREDRREGYPLESDTMPGRLLNKSLIFYPAPKTFLMGHGGGTSNTVPTGRGDTRTIAARPIARWPGAPLQPTDPLPLLAGVGPGAWAERANVPDMTVENHPRIVPLRAAPTFYPATNGPDPRGYSVYGLDRARAGRVVELWIDRSESILRYLEVELDASPGPGMATAGSATRMGQGFEAKAPPRPAAVGTLTSAAPIEAGPAGGHRILVPTEFANIHARRKTVTVKAVTGAQLAMAPLPATPDQVTMLEEDKIMGFYGAGFLYATPQRAEPLL